MPTEIVQTESNGRVYLRVSGDLLSEDALLLERITNELIDSSDAPVIVDLADLGLLDSDSAAVLRRIQSTSRIEIHGMEIFVQSAIDMAERVSR